MKPHPLILLALTACATASAPPQPAAPTPVAKALAYALPSNTATYAFSDTSSFQIKAPDQSIDVTIADAGTAELAMASATGGIQATVRVLTFAGSMLNSAMGGGASATEKEIEGNAVLTITPRGSATVTTMPKLGRSIQSVGLSESFFRRFFIRLPASSVPIGAVWVDTIQTVDESSGIKASVRDISTSTLVGDTTIAGATVAVISITAQRKLEISGTNEGVQIAQHLNGSVTGRAYWDRQKNLLVDRVETSQLNGTFDLPQMGMSGLPLTAKSVSKMTLR
ncbi:MAG TPA: hypothetical protein VM100_02195 [Longimicrobiales bacterium]|nr:hypothetical protein [Longimicrobiales bacterium]